MPIIGKEATNNKLMIKKAIGKELLLLLSNCPKLV
jgi:hypothetical protein